MARPAKRDQLLATAKRLFYREGIRATGIDRILQEADVARMTLYNHFAGKDALIAAALQDRSDHFRDWLKTEIARRADEPAGQLLAVFDVLGDWIRGEAAAGAFAGCAFIKSAAEFADPADPVHRLAAAHKAALRADLAHLAAEAGAADPEDLAAALLLLVDGALVTVQMSGDPRAVTRARSLAALALAAGLPSAPNAPDAPAGLPSAPNAPDAPKAPN